MYVLIVKETGFIGFYIEKTLLLEKIQKSRTTFLRKMKNKKWETEEFIIYQPDFVQIKSRKGDKRGKNLPKTHHSY